jgi:hypothetical protein
MNKPSRSCIAVAVAAAMTAGCATGPVPRWDPPAAAQSEDTRSFGYARRYADNVKQSYQRAIDREVLTNGRVGTALIVLGGAVAALAGFKANHDTILGATLVGGTAYGVANWNSAKARLAYYQKGIESIECAKMALRPLEASADEVTSLDAALADLSVSMPKVETRLKSTKAMLEALQAANLRKDLADAADAVVKLTEDGLKNAETTLKAGEQLKKRRSTAGQQLIDHVNATDVAIQRMGLQTIPELSATKAIINNIPTWGPLTAGAAPSKEGAKPGAQGERGGETPPDEAGFKAAVADLQTAYEAMQKDVNRVGAHTESAKLSDIDTALRSCDVTSTSAALNTVPDMLTFTGAANESQTIFVSGGEKQYVGTAGDNFTVTTQDSSLIVTAKQAVNPGKYILLVKDSTKPTPQERPLQIVVNDKASQTGQSAQTPQSTTKAATPDSIVAQLKTKLVSLQISSTQQIKLSEPHANDKGVVTVKVSCDPANPTPKLQLPAVRAKIVEALDGGKAFVEDNPERIVIDPALSPNCFEAA